MDLLTWLRQEAQLKKMVLVIVFIALFLDHMLLSVAVPIIPSYLYRIEQAATTTSVNSTDSAVTYIFIQSLSNLSGMWDSIFAPSHSNPEYFNNAMATKSPDSNSSGAGAQLDELNTKVGLLLASKSTIQLIFNPFTGTLIDRIGYHVPMCAGFCIIILATTLFAFSSSYILLLFARSVQGVGGSCLSVAGMSMLADVFKDDKERGRAMGISFTGLALGLIAGAPFGSVMYQYVGKMSPFLVLAVIAVLGGGLHSLIFQPSPVQTVMEKGTPLLTLLKDPYILIAAGAICFSTLIIATVEAALPIWMMTTMYASEWQLGVVFLPDSISYLIASNACSLLIQQNSGRWICACIGMIVAGITTIFFGFSKTIYHVIVLNAFVGLSVGAVDSSLMPIMGYLVDRRYVPVYGTVFAIADIAICIGFCVGPAITGPMVSLVGFPWLMVIIGTVTILFAPLCIFLYGPTRKEEYLTFDELVTYPGCTPPKPNVSWDQLHNPPPERSLLDTLPQHSDSK